MFLGTLHPFPQQELFGDSNKFVSLNSRHSWVFIPTRISNPQISDATDAGFSIEELRGAILQNGVLGSFLLVSLSCSTSSSAARLIGNLVGKRTGISIISYSRHIYNLPVVSAISFLIALKQYNLPSRVIIALSMS